ncbi:MAG: DUF1997 domain-containing protein [Cyanobacteria bacterium]|nr:DUF1997 domain-containing protein [Cyanobacteriota bacterium]MDW8203145.1 DUF1997 domain-containing protein [Cyanobacteriota bacterium SKYGB_h_bin112]
MPADYPTQNHAETPAEALSNIEALSDSDSMSVEDETLDKDVTTPVKPFRFFTRFVDAMEMYADTATVETYFDVHGGWFKDCAAPMKAEPIGTTGYALTIGRFGAFGYQVEPRIGLDLIPAENRVYRIQTIPIPGYEAPGYEIDFQASMTLVEDASQEITLQDKRNGTITKLSVLTRVEWDLQLTVWIQFPRFIYRLPHTMLQNTGNHLLRQIVREVSNRLTRKVQDDFHSKRGLPSPYHTKRI